MNLPEDKGKSWPNYTASFLTFLFFSIREVLLSMRCFLEGVGSDEILDGRLVSTHISLTPYIVDSPSEVKDLKVLISSLSFETESLPSSSSLVFCSKSF